MTETLPAVRPASDLDVFARLGMWLALAEGDPNRPNARAAAAALRLYYARDLGLSAHAAAELSIIGGRLVVSAQLLRALARRAGYRVERLTVSDNAATCTARITDVRTGELLGESTFSIKDAERAGLIRDRSAWKTHPARMLWARASKNAITDFAPEVALGLTLDDEVQEIVHTAAHGAPTDEPPPPAPHDADHGARAATVDETDVPYDLDDPDDADLEDEDPAAEEVDDIAF